MTERPYGETELLNLLDDKWQLMRQVDGGGEQVGLRGLLLESHRYEDLVVDAPTQKPALYRQLLLPLVVDALHEKLPTTAEAWAEMFARGAFSTEEAALLDSYCDKYRSSFELFHATDPFAQVAGLRTARDETKSATALVATAAHGNNVPLFSSRTDGDELRLDPGQAVRWLLHTHCWDTGAIKTGVVGDPKVAAGKTMGNPVSPLGRLGVVLPRGRTVFDTLMLNIPAGRQWLDSDRPQWRRRALQGHVEDTLSCATPAWDHRHAKGPRDAWTWQSRRIRLLPGHGPDGTPYVSQVVIAAGDRLRVTPDAEFHTAWVTGRDGKSKARANRDEDEEMIRPRRHVAGRAAWRGLNALLSFARSYEQADATPEKIGYATTELLMSLAGVRDLMPPDYPLQLELTGVTYGTKLGNIEDAFYDEIPLPLAALEPEGTTRISLLEAVTQAEDLAKAVNLLDADLRRAAGSDPIPLKEWQYPGETLLHILDPLVRTLLVGLRSVGEDDEAGDAQLVHWEREARRAAWRVAEQLLSRTTPGSFAGRAVTLNSATRMYRLSDAEHAFDRTLRKILARRAGHPAL